LSRDPASLMWGRSYIVIIPSGVTWTFTRSGKSNGVLPARLRELRLTESGFLPAAPLVSLAAAAGAGGIAAWGVCGDPLLVGSRFLRFGAKWGLPMIFRFFIDDVLGSPIFKQPSNQYQARFVRIGELAAHKKPPFLQTVNRILYRRTAGRKCST